MLFLKKALGHLLQHQLGLQPAAAAEDALADQLPRRVPQACDMATRTIWP